MPLMPKKPMPKSDAKPSIASAYDMKRRNVKKMAKGGMISESAKTEQRPMPSEQHNDKKMIGDNMKSMPKPKIQGLARGGMVESSLIKARPLDSMGRRLDEQEEDMIESMPPEKHDGMSSDKSPSDEEIMADHIEMMAEGGEIEDEQPMEEMDEEDHSSIADAIMARKKRMADGGMVDIDSNNMEEPNQMDELNEAALKENYDSDMEDVSQPMDSNEHGHDLSDEDAHDMISKIRAAMNRQRR